MSRDLTAPVVLGSAVMLSVAEEIPEDGKMPALRNAEGDGVDKDDIRWGPKLSAKTYKSVFIKDEEYFLYDCVRCRSPLGVDSIGKIMKLREDKDKKLCTIRWFFYVSELPEGVTGLDYTPDARELFLASGEGKGVENENLLVRSISSTGGYLNVENELSLEVIVGKCRVLCTAVADFNELPSKSQVKAADYFFDKAFDCDDLQVTSLDGLVDSIGAQRVFNRKEWVADKTAGFLSHSSSQVSSPRTNCHSSGSGSLPTYGEVEGNLTAKVQETLLPPANNVRPASVLEGSKFSKEGKRQRDGTEDGLLQQAENSDGRVVNGSPTSKKLKLSSQNSLLYKEQGDQQNELMTESRTLISPSDGSLQSKDKQRKQPNHVGDESQLSSPKSRLEEVGKVKKDLVPKSSVLKSSRPPLEAKPVSKGRERDSSHKLKRKESTLSGGTRSNLLKPLERPERLPGMENFSKVQRRIEKGKGSRQEVVQLKVGTNKSGGLADADKKSSQAMKRKADAEPVTMLKSGSEKEKLASLNMSATKKPDTSDPSRSRIHTEVEQVSRKLEHRKLKSDHLDPQKVARIGSIFKSKEQSLPEKELITVEAERTAAAEKVKVRVSGSPVDSPGSPKAEDREAAQAETRKPLFVKPPYEVWEDSIERAVKARRVLLLKNLDPELHSTDLEELLTDFLKTKCEVRKAPPTSFLYYSSAEALMKVSTPKKAEEILQRLEESYLVLGDRPCFATLFDFAQFSCSVPKFFGHINIQSKRHEHREDYINAVATSHGAQGNTIEFAYGLPWRVLQEQHDIQWQLLSKAQAQDIKDLEKGEVMKAKKPPGDKRVVPH